MPTHDEINAANEQEIDKLQDLIKDLKSEIEGIKRDGAKQRQQIENALERMRKAREILDEPSSSYKDELHFWLGQQSVEYYGDAFDRRKIFKGWNNISFDDKGFTMLVEDEDSDEENDKDAFMQSL